MANFDINIGDAGAQYPQSISVPQTSVTSNVASGLTAITNGLFGVADANRRIAAASAPTESQINRSAFGAFAQSVQDLRGIEDPVQLRSAVNTIVADYQANGFEFGEAEANLVLRDTGIDLNIQSPEVAATNTVLSKLGENPQYLELARRELESAKARTGQDFTQEDVVARAYTLYQTTEADTLSLAVYRAGSNSEYITNVIPTANRLIPRLAEVAYSALAVEVAGGNVSPESFLQLEANVVQLEAMLTPTGPVDEDVQAPIKAQITAIRSVLEQAKGYDTNLLDMEVTDNLEVVTRTLLDIARETGDTNAALTATLMSTPEGRQAWGAINAGEMRTVLNNSKPVVLEAMNTTVDNAVRLDFSPFNDALNAALGIETAPAPTPAPAPTADGTTPAPAPAPTVSEAVTATQDTLWDPEVLDQYRNLSNSDRQNLIDLSSGILVKPATVLSLNNQEQRDAFVGGVGQVTGAISTTNRLMDPAQLNTIFSQDFFANMDRLAIVDREAYDMTRARVQSTLLKQMDILTTTYQASLSDSVLDVRADGSFAVNMNRVAGVTGFDPTNVPPLYNFQRYADEMYNGSLADLIADRGSKIPNEMVRGIVVGTLLPAYSKLREYGQVRRSVNRLLRRSGVDAQIVQLQLDQSVPAYNPEPAYNPPADLVTTDAQGNTVPTNQTLYGDPLGRGTIIPQNPPAIDAAAQTQIDRAQASAEAMAAADKLATSTGEIVTSTLAPLGTASEPYRARWGQGDDTAAYNEIPAGSFYVDPNGTTRYKAQ